MAVVNAYPVQNPAPNCAYCGEPFKPEGKSSLCMAIELGQAVLLGVLR
jgi:hypothetical protein